jgi:hypothetical protein
MSYSYAQFLASPLPQVWGSVRQRVDIPQGVVMPLAEALGDVAAVDQRDQPSAHTRSSSARTAKGPMISRAISRTPD